MIDYQTLISLLIIAAMFLGLAFNVKRCNPR